MIHASSIREALDTGRFDLIRFDVDDEVVDVRPSTRAKNSKMCLGLNLQERSPAPAN